MRLEDDSIYNKLVLDVYITVASPVQLNTTFRANQVEVINKKWKKHVGRELSLVAHIIVALMNQICFQHIVFYYEDRN